MQNSPFAISHLHTIESIHLTLHQLHTEETTEAKSSCNLGNKKGPHRSANKEMLENRIADILATWRRLQILKLGHHNFGQRVYKCISCHILSYISCLSLCPYTFAFCTGSHMYQILNGSKHGRSRTLSFQAVQSPYVASSCRCERPWMLHLAAISEPWPRLGHAQHLIQFIQVLSVTK